MNVDTLNEQMSDALSPNRLLRTAVGVAAFSAVLAGYETAPAGIFILSAASLYFITTAIVGQGLLDVLFRVISGAAREAVLTHGHNIGRPARVARGAAAGAALGSVLSGTFAMDAGDIFALNAAGFFLGTTAAVAWCPVVAMLNYLSARGTDSAGPKEPSAGTVVSPLPGRMSRAATTGKAKDVKEAA